MNPFITHNPSEYTTMAEHFFDKMPDNVPEHLQELVTIKDIESCIYEDVDECGSSFDVDWKLLNQGIIDNNWGVILLNYYFAIWCKVQERINTFDELADNATGEFGFIQAMSQKKRYVDLAEWLRNRIELTF